MGMRGYRGQRFYDYWLGFAGGCGGGGSGVNWKQQAFPACMLSCFSRVRLAVILWTVAHQAPLSMGFSRQGYWSGLPFPPPGDLPHPGIEPVSPEAPVLQVDSLSLSHREAHRLSLVFTNEVNLSVPFIGLFSWVGAEGMYVSEFHV